MEIMLQQTETGLATLDGQPVACHWFAKCPNQATQLQAHPVLGPIPTCDSCHEFVEANSKRN